MRNDRVGRVLLVAAGLLLTAGCATSEEWTTWKEHSTHFASGEHLFFSTRNREGAAPRVTRQDIALARTESWWGKPVTVNQDQILER
ncbi:MAG TPA: hypothetical protein VLI67_02255 [Vicinamibacteria bacterium]|nr:hypothetical protein [Vicinamibacteria bacterium]